MSSSSRDLPPCELIPLQDWSLERQKNKENLLQHRPCGPVAHHTVYEAARSNSIGSLFFSPLYVCEFCNLHADGIQFLPGSYKPKMLFFPVHIR